MDPHGDSPTALASDVQSHRPSTLIGLSRVGVTGVEKVIRIGSNGSEQLFYAELECFVDLPPHQKGAHMSRFEEVVNEVIGEVVLGEEPALYDSANLDLAVVADEAWVTSFKAGRVYRVPLG